MEKLTNFDRFQVLPVEKLVKADWNYKEEDEHLTTKLVENIKRNGQIENIIVRELGTGFFEIVNGNHRYDAMKTVGTKEVVVCNLGAITLAHAQRVAVETNETKFATNTARLATLLSDIAKEYSVEDLAASMPYSQERLHEFIGISEFDWNSITNNTDTDSSDHLDEDAEGSSIHIKLTPRERDRWNAWVEKSRDITVGEWKAALLVLLTVSENLTLADIENALVK